MTRLTKELRQSILSDILAHAFKHRFQHCIDAEKSFVDAVYKDVFKKELPLIENVPKNWLDTHHCFKVMFAGEVAALYFGTGLSSGPYQLTESLQVSLKHEFRPMPSLDKFGTFKVYDAGSKMAEAFSKLRGQKNDLIDEIKIASYQANAVLNSTSSIPKLLDIWPEAKEIILKVTAPKYAQKTTSNLPAMQISQLNVLLDLPPEPAAA